MCVRSGWWQFPVTAAYSRAPAGEISIDGGNNFSEEQAYSCVPAGEISIDGGNNFSEEKAYGRAPAGEISVYDYLQVIFSAGQGLLIFGQVPDLLSWTDCAVICTMAALMF